jgi:hypothetical protein
MCTSCWSLVTGHWSLVAGHWLLVAGHWLLKFKIVSSEKIIRQFGYYFKYKSPNQYLQSLAE